MKTLTQLVPRLKPLFARRAVRQQTDHDTLQCTVAYNRYGGYCVPLSSRHRPAAKKILANKVYEPLTLAFMRQNCGDGDVVHAGTYFGDFLPALSSALSPSGKIWAFEPNPENHRCARITLEINGIDNVWLTHAGLGAAPDEMPMQTVDASGRALGGASRLTTEPQRESTQVKIVAIDDVLDRDRRVSIIQLDVEGHEKEALSGALQTIKTHLPIIILEVLPQSTLTESDWFSSNILALGYVHVGNVHGNSIFSCDNHENSARS